METIVVGYNDSGPARAALSWAAAEARQRQARLLVVYVVSSVGEWELAAAQINPDPIRHEFERRLAEEWTAPLRDEGIDYDTKVLVGQCGHAIRHCAVEADASMIVVGMTHRGTLSEFLSDNPEHDLAQHALRPVVAVPPDWKA
jgi:nucleotide-binding universal stress UspA family protein